jgi:hypothetical protein
VSKMVTEQDHVSRQIVTSREPVAPKTAGDKGSTGDQALMDAVLIVVGAWALLFLLAFSLRKHNV